MDRFDRPTLFAKDSFLFGESPGMEMADFVKLVDPSVRAEWPALVRDAYRRVPRGAPREEYLHAASTAEEAARARGEAAVASSRRLRPPTRSTRYGTGRYEDRRNEEGRDGEERWDDVLLPRMD
jgi:hypothetical protein